MTTKKASKAKTPQAKKSPARIQRIPSPGFHCCGSWVSKDGGVIIAGVDTLYGPPIGALGLGPSGSVADLNWISLSPEVAAALHTLAVSETPVGLCGTRILDGGIEESIWSHFDNEDLDSFAQAVVMIRSELTKSK